MVLVTMANIAVLIISTFNHLVAFVRAITPSYETGVNGGIGPGISGSSNRTRNSTRIGI